MRATPEDVQAIFPTSRDIVPYLVTAATLVETYLSAAGYSETLLWEIERWWTAHLLSLESPAVTARKIGGTDIDYEHGTMGEGLASTRYGQVVLMLDKDGALIRSVTSTEGVLQRAKLWVD